MLYDRWRSIVNANRSSTALVDASDGRRWTFAQLAAASEAEKAAPGVAFPNTNGPEFLLMVLRAWRIGQVVCPLEAGQAKPSLTQPPPEGIAHLKTTSATGGDPRLVAFTEEQIAADPANLVVSMGLRPEWPNLGVISLAHSYGFSNLVLPLLLHGIPLVLVRSALPEALKRAAEGHPCMTLAGVPALWSTWAEARSIPGNVRLAISAGAPLPLTTERLVYERFGLKIHNFYGSSECGGIAYDDSNSPREDASCVGKPVNGVEVRIEGGCVVVRGKAVAAGYWPTPSEKLTDGVFATSDLGLIQDDTIYLRGRVGDLINVAGRKVAPEAIEQVLCSHPAVRQCLAFGVPLEDSHRGESIVGCIACTTRTSGQELRRWLGSRLPAWQVPRDWWFVEDLPSNQRGKLSRAEWRERYLAHRKSSS